MLTQRLFAAGAFPAPMPFDFGVDSTLDSVVGSTFNPCGLAVVSSSMLAVKSIRILSKERSKRTDHSGRTV